MSTERVKPNRRKFISWGLASAAVIAAINFFRTTPPASKTVKMLTREGKLVEVDIAAIPGQRRKITNGELQVWIKNKPQDKTNH